ncbi:head-tail joining protein [Vibrio sp. C8]
MSIWEDAVTDMDSALMAEFSVSVTLHLEAGDSEVSGIFDNPCTLSQLPNGGDVLDTEPELYLNDADAVSIKRYQFVTVGTVKWQIVKPPEPDGTGMTKLILGHSDGLEIEKPDIRYRS